MYERWRMREDEGDIDIPEMRARYERNPSYFTIKMHHGGCFSKYPGRKYVGGTVAYFDQVDGDEFSVLEIDSMLEVLGYDEKCIAYYHYRQPDVDLDYGLNALGNDHDVMNMIPYALRHRIIDVYIEHGITTVKTYWRSPQKSKVVIELLDEDPNEHRPIDRPRPKKTKAKRLELEWHGNDQGGECSGNKNFDGGEVYKPVMEKSVSEGPGDILPNVCSESSFNPFDGLDDILGSNAFGLEEPVVDRHEEPLEEPVDDRHEEPLVESTSDSGSENSDEDDSDFEEDEYNKVVDVEVDMREFHSNVDHGVESIGRQTENSNGDDTEVNPEIGGLNFSDFESGSGSDDDELGRIRKRKLRELRKCSKPANVDEQEAKVQWYVGQLLDGPPQIKDLVKMHAVETRRYLFFDKNDKERIRVKCRGGTPCYGQQNGGPQQEGNLEKEVGEQGDKTIKGVP